MQKLQLDPIYKIQLNSKLNTSNTNLNSENRTIIFINKRNFKQLVLYIGKEDRNKSQFKVNLRASRLRS
jgi:hypothetical protein